LACIVQHENFGENFDENFEEKLNGTEGEDKNYAGIKNWTKSTQLSCSGIQE
jgi:hypothetical protein